MTEASFTQGGVETSQRDTETPCFEIIHCERLSRTEASFIEGGVETSKGTQGHNALKS